LITQVTLVLSRHHGQRKPGKVYRRSSGKPLYQNISLTLTFDYFYTAIGHALGNCTELIDNLVKIYFKSGVKGNPTSEWGLQYKPLEVCTVQMV